MTIETNNLILREFTPEDAAALHAVLSDAETMSFWPAPFTMEQSLAWIERSMKSFEDSGFGRRAIIFKETGALIGTCGIMRLTSGGEPVNDLGYIIHRDYWGKGLATEAAAAVMEHAFAELGLKDLHANMAYNHHASRRVAERLGMTKVREFANERNRNIWTLLYKRSAE